MQLILLQMTVNLSLSLLILAMFHERKFAENGSVLMRLNR